MKRKTAFNSLIVENWSMGLFFTLVVKWNVSKYCVADIVWQSDECAGSGPNKQINIGALYSLRVVLN
jgi:hypothetical protein